MLGKIQSIVRTKSMIILKEARLTEFFYLMSLQCSSRFKIGPQNPSLQYC